MELSVVRIHKAGTSGAKPWVHARSVIQPDYYLSQCPFILLNEESHAPRSTFPIHSHEGVLVVTLVLDGNIEKTDGNGTVWSLGRGDAEFSIGGGDVVQGTASAELGAKLLHLWINLPATLKPASAHHQVVRLEGARGADHGDAMALLYAGTLGTSTGPHASPWPTTVADVLVQAGKRSSLALASNERSFVYVLSGSIELGRNQVQLNRGNVAWIERTVRPGDVNSLSVRAAKDTRFLLFSSPVIGEAESADDGGRAACAADPTPGLPLFAGARPAVSKR